MDGEQLPADDIDRRVASATRAQRAFAGRPEDDVDRVLTGLADVVTRHARDLAERTVAGTGMGCAADKTRKNLFVADDVLRSLRGRAGGGVLRSDAALGVTEVARPVGVVLGLMPVTNPVATLAFAVMIAVGSRNALVVRAHPRAAGVTEHAAGLLRAALAGSGAPAGLLQVVPPADRDQVQRLLRHPGVDLVLVTGSTGLVRAAASSGKPTLGAGAGNAPAWICADADVGAAARMVVDSKSFDHGMICGSEQHLVVDRPVVLRVIEALRSAGAAVLGPAEVARLEAALFADGRLRRELVGRSAGELAERAGIAVRTGTRLLVAPLPPGAAAGPWGTERLVPVLGLHPVAGEAAALGLCRELLARGGAGHTAAIHTRCRSTTLAFAASVPASRVIVNGPASQGCIGLGNGLTPSLTLGCGPAGGATTTDNITYTHLLQVVRVAGPVPPDPCGPVPAPRSVLGEPVPA